jgi:Holliday junction resolvasome RuvABC ATP-dependent DNA helicase subunit
MLAAPSGYGKTRMALLMCNYLCRDGKFNYILCDRGEHKFNPQYRVHFYDEVHKLENPEFLYPIMDSRKYVIILATNESGNVLEPLWNRCVPLLFSDYSTEELRYIIRRAFPYNVDDAFIDAVVEAGSRNPRVILSITHRLCTYVRQRGIPTDITEVLRNFFGIEDGLDIASRRYITYLQTVGGRASIDTLSSGLHLSKSTLLYQVEPILLYRKLIQITSRGRILC